MCRVGLHRLFLQPSDLSCASGVLRQDSTSLLLRGVSVLELCLIIAMKHITEVTSGESFNFEMVYSGTLIHAAHHVLCIHCFQTMFGIGSSTLYSLGGVCLMD